MKSWLLLTLSLFVISLAAFFSSAQSGNPRAGSGYALGLIQEDAKSYHTASTTLDSKSGSTITGTARFTQKDDSVLVEVEVAGAKPGKHGVHLHETGDCSAADAKSAGGHFNPDKTAHGAPDVEPHHAGDFGNLEVGQDGTGRLTLTAKDLTVAPGPHSVVGRALVVHADADDLKSQPAGNSGARNACGVIRSGSM